jgi:hypothetical protein
MHIKVNKCALCIDSEIVAKEIDNFYNTSKQLIEFKDLLWDMFTCMRTLKILCTKCTETSIWRIIMDSMEKPSSDTFQDIGFLNSSFQALN